MHVRRLVVLVAQIAHGNHVQAPIEISFLQAGFQYSPISLPNSSPRILNASFPEITPFIEKAQDLNASNHGFDGQAMEGTQPVILFDVPAHVHGAAALPHPVVIISVLMILFVVVGCFQLMLAGEIRDLTSSVKKGSKQGGAESNTEGSCKKGDKPGSAEGKAEGNTGQAEEEEHEGALGWLHCLCCCVPNGVLHFAELYGSLDTHSKMIVLQWLAMTGVGTLILWTTHLMQPVLAQVGVMVFFIAVLLGFGWMCCTLATRPFLIKLTKAVDYICQEAEKEAARLENDVTSGLKDVVGKQNERRLMNAARACCSASNRH